MTIVVLGLPNRINTINYLLQPAWKNVFYECYLVYVFRCAALSTGRCVGAVLNEELDDFQIFH